MAFAARSEIESVIRLHADHYYKSYGLACIMGNLLDLVISNPDNFNIARLNTNRFREALITLREGETTATETTRKIYANLGRESETDNNWV